MPGREFSMIRLARGTILVFLLLISGCSASFLYNQLDWLVPWYAKDYVDFSASQRTDFDRRVEDFLGWHRSEELETYLDILDSVEADLQRPLTVASLEQWQLEMKSAWSRLEQRGLPMALEVVDQFSDAQITTFFDNLQKEQQELEKEHLSQDDGEFRDLVYEELEDGMEFLLGKLNSAQKLNLRQAVTDMQRFDHVWLAQRQHFLDQAKTILQREPGWRTRATEMMADREALELQEFTLINEHNRQVVFVAITEVINVRTEKQDRELRQLIKGLRADMHTLIAQQD
jgi:hypothetical protein